MVTHACGNYVWSCLAWLWKRSSLILCHSLSCKEAQFLHHVHFMHDQSLRKPQTQSLVWSFTIWKWQSCRRVEMNLPFSPLHCLMLNARALCLIQAVINKCVCRFCEQDQVDVHATRVCPSIPCFVPGGVICTSFYSSRCSAGKIVNGVTASARTTPRV